MRFFASISYNGSGFSGWQIQQNAPSIQDEVQKALSAVLREKTDVTGAGRTDTGVNASGFTAHFDFDGDIILKEHDRIIYKINAILTRTPGSTPSAAPTDTTSTAARTLSPESSRGSANSLWTWTR